MITVTIGLEQETDQRLRKKIKLNELESYSCGTIKAWEDSNTRHIYNVHFKNNGC